MFSSSMSSSLPAFGGCGSSSRPRALCLQCPAARCLVQQDHQLQGARARAQPVKPTEHRACLSGCAAKVVLHSKKAVRETTGPWPGTGDGHDETVVRGFYFFVMVDAAGNATWPRNTSLSLCRRSSTIARLVFRSPNKLAESGNAPVEHTHTHSRQELTHVHAHGKHRFARTPDDSTGGRLSAGAG